MPSRQNTWADDESTRVGSFSTLATQATLVEAPDIRQTRNDAYYRRMNAIRREVIETEQAASRAAFIRDGGRREEGCGCCCM